ncbi:trk system potassium uptake protein TrkH [Plasticicumulans lactativorans]|uniref:Trk system potassium uptake protein n=1 Tax=Plasticicumulans lactativorans TaxID=1133106 RepID=A0A4V2SDA3_9GAMM|nr:trk system potassium uptake protein TrkH [Plasticicumulans lactativorans]
MNAPRHRPAAARALDPRPQRAVGLPLPVAPIKASVKLFGLLLMMFAVTMLPPVLVAAIYRDGAGMAFVQAGALSLGTGLACWLPLRRHQIDLRNRDGFLVVVAFWFTLSLLSAIPFMLADAPHMPLVDAVFEAVSGLTTTGATVLSGLDTLPRAIVYYRAQLNFLGGMGIVVLAVALLPMLGVGGMQLYRAETPGPMKDEKLTPRITETAKNLWFIYVGLNLLCTAAFLLAGMDLFDAVCHSFATLALGGFSTHDASIGYYQSPAIELVAGFFSLVAAVNFALFFFAWRARSLRAILADEEFRFAMKVMWTLIGVAIAGLYLSGTFPPWEAVYHGFFQTASVITDNGLVTAGYPDWPHWVVLVLLLGSFFGGCVGSTCGGIKAVRFLLLYRQSQREVKLLIRPTAQIPVKLGNRTVPERVMQAVLAFYFLYIFAYCACSVGVAMTGVDLITAFGSVAGCINNMGVGLGQTAGSFAPLNDDAVWILTASMLIGRLEVFPLLLLFQPSFWR